MTDGEEDSDSVEEGEVWEEEGGYLVISTDKVDCLFVCCCCCLFVWIVKFGRRRLVTSSFRLTVRTCYDSP